MKLILTDKVPELGDKGDLVDVSEGFARNFLLPKKKAVPASEGALIKAERVRQSREAAEVAAREDASRLASQLAGTRVVLAAPAGDEGKLYGSIAVADLIEGIRKFTGIELEKKNLESVSPIKAIGLHEVTVRLHKDVEFPIVFDVIPT